MTAKQEKILNAALELFAHEGYNVVSTSKIAQKAGVSEGLIFRHFESKQGLLNAILQQAFDKVAELYAPILIEENPKQALVKAITLLFEGDEEEYHFWKLQYKLKWELEISGREKTKPFLNKLSWAFEALGYSNPQKEAEVLQHILESILGGIIKDGMASQQHLKEFLLDKYQL
ncbi:MAG: helix-turn-helix domain-containing protein [Bacteroidota bacterium]